MDHLRQIRLAATVESPEQTDQAGAHDRSGCDPERLGEMQGCVIHGRVGGWLAAAFSRQAAEAGLVEDHFQQQQSEPWREKP